MIRETRDRLQKSFLGRSFYKGAGEAFGYHYTSGGQKLGFMGLGDPALKTMSTAGKVGTTAFRSLGLAGTAFLAYQGWREEGVWGAAKGVGESVLYGAAFQVAAGVLTSPVSLAAGVIGGIGYGAYRFGEAAQAHRKKLRRLEMGGGMDNVIRSSGALTDRQRSVQALNDSRINARMALGNEANLLHTSYR
jgi:hypothetical protein